jgi:hypothetical protein
MRRLIYISIIALTLNACKNGPCFTSAGDTIIERRELNDQILNVNLFDNLNLDIYIDTGYFLEVVAGSNLQDKIVTKFSESTLELRNDNSCSQFRGFDNKLKVRLHVPRLNSIYYSGYGDITMMDTMRNHDFKFTAENGSGKVKIINDGNVKIDCIDSYSKISLSNSTHVDELSISIAGTCWIHAENFFAQSVYVDNNSTGDCIVHVGNDLTYSIKNIGNIKYYGSANPIIKKIDHSGKGRLIRAN